MFFYSNPDKHLKNSLEKFITEYYDNIQFLCFCYFLFFCFSQFAAVAEFSLTHLECIISIFQ